MDVHQKSSDPPSYGPRRKREVLRDATLRNALTKRTAGVPTYSVPEAAALLSVSSEYLYRLIQGDSFPAVRMRVAGTQGRYVVPAKAVEQLLADTTASCSQVELSEWTNTRWNVACGGGAR